MKNSWSLHNDRAVDFFFFNYTATTEIYTLSLHDALPISRAPRPATAPTSASRPPCTATSPRRPGAAVPSTISPPRITRSWAGVGVVMGQYCTATAWSLTTPPPGATLPTTMMKRATVESTADAYLELLAARGEEYFFANAGTDFAPLIEAYARRSA